MAIKDPILFITIEEFKEWKGFNELLFDKVTTPDNEIWFAISVASNNINYLSGFTISKKWPEITQTDFTDNIQTATAHYVRFLLTKDVDYLRGQGSISQSGLTYSETNPEDPYFIPPEVFNCLRKIKEYPNIKGFNLKGIEPQKNNYFNKFISNCGEDSPLNEYILYNNIKSLDPRTKITITHPQNILRPIVNIDTNSIKTIDNLQTNELFTKYFSNDAFELVDGKLEQQSKVINISGNVPNILINEATYDTLKTDNKTISGAINENLVGNRRTYEYTRNLFKLIDELHNTKQSKTDNTLITDAKTVVGAINEIKNKNVDLKDYYKKEEIDTKLDDDFGYIERKKQDKIELVVNLSSVRTYTITDFDINKYGYFLHIYNDNGAVSTFNIFCADSHSPTFNNYYYSAPTPNLKPIANGGHPYFGWLITWTEKGKLTSYLTNKDGSVNEEDFSFNGEIYRFKK